MSRKLHLFDLPPEILHRILVFSVISRGVARALRLKLVCQYFHDALQLALFETRLLDEFGNEPRFGRLCPMENWRIRNLHGAERLWHSYIAYRVRTEVDPLIGRYVEIRRVVEAWCDRTKADYDETLEALCWLVLERSDMMPGERECWIRHGHTDDSPNLELNLLSAAAHFGHVSLADELLRDGHSPTGSNNIFASPLFLAAYAGNMEMVKLLLDHMPEGIANGRILTKHEAQGIDGALQSGNLDMVRLAAFPPLGISPDPSPDWHQVPYSVEHLRNRIETTKSPEVYHYVQDLTPDFPLSESWKAKILATHAEYGNLEMVRCLLDEGVPWNNSRINGAPLVVAADLSQEKVVELLIERGADPNFIGNGSQRGTPLCAAAACGSLSIVRKLLDNGARIGSDYDRALRYAVLREHTAMVEFLIKHNPLNESTRSTLKWIASSSSLDSMVELLERLDRGMSPPSS